MDPQESDTGHLERSWLQREPENVTNHYQRRRGENDNRVNVAQRTAVYDHRPAP